MRARVFAVVLVAGLAFDAAPVAADDAVQGGSAEHRFAEVSNAVCFRQAAGQIAFGASVDDDTRLMAEAGLSFGTTSPTLERLGRDGIVLVSQSILGGAEVGGDGIVVAVGGRIPGCRTILLRKNASGQGETVAALLTASGWKETPASNVPGASSFRRTFVRRDAAGRPYLLNLHVAAARDTEVHLVSTVTAIPANVVLPAGL